VKRRDLERKIRRAANAAGVTWVMVRQGGNHELWQAGETRVTIPRHRELNDITAEGIMKDLDIEFGEGWWR
jgi:mRNA interferase HicA